jgi:hypothetical protein
MCGEKLLLLEIGLDARLNSGSSPSGRKGKTFFLTSPLIGLIDRRLVASLGPVACICHCHPKTKTITH